MKGSYSMTTLPRSTALVVLLAAAHPAIALAQAPGRSADNPCFRARAAPECSVFFITNAGVYIKPATTNGASLRAIVDWGVMVNASPRHAIGGSWFVTLDEDDFTTGPVVRYRLWFEGDRSLDVAVGTPIAGGDNLKAGSILGLVKYNPVHWFGVAVRPEYVRRTVFSCVQGICAETTATSGRVYAGVEFGWFPGLALSLGGGVALGALIIAVVASGGWD